MTRILFRAALCLLAVAVVASCGRDKQSTISPAAPVTPTRHHNVTLAVTSVRVVPPHTQAIFDTSVAPSFSNPTSFTVGHIVSGPPDYLKITVNRIEIEGSWGTDTLWSGSKELTVDGSSVDVSDMNASLRSIHPGTATMVRTWFQSAARIRGTLNAKLNADSVGFNPQNLVLYTKAAYPYDAMAHTGGADSLARFTTGPAEEADFWLSGDASEFMVQTPCSAVIGDSTTNNPLTILFDLSRVLRFYDGCSGDQGPNPPDPRRKAYFFGHSLLGSFVATFFGTPGSIEGYRTCYSAHVLDHYEGVTGWLTLVFGPSGEFLSGMLMGDDDNALTVAKGRVLTFAAEGGTYNFTYDIAQGAVTGFKRETMLYNYTPVATWSTTDPLSSYSGEAYFHLELKQ